MASPIVLLSGCVGFGEEYTRVEGFSNADVGAVVPERHNRRRAPRQRPAPGVRNPRWHAQCDRPAEPRGRQGCRRHSARPRFFGNALHRQRVRLDGRRIRAGDGALRRFGYRRDRDQHLLPERQGRWRAFGNDPEMSARVVAACRAQTSKPLITKLSPNQTDIQRTRDCVSRRAPMVSLSSTR